MPAAQLTYTVRVQYPLRHELGRLRSKVDSVLSDDRTWPVKFTRDDLHPDFSITLVEPGVVERACGLSNDLSCASMDHKWVLLNARRWFEGSAKSNLDLDDYRTYVINHEVGHVLLLNHPTLPPRPGEPCPVMIQQTLGTGYALKNVWPLAEEAARIQVRK